jgi:exonuclease III
MVRQKRPDVLLHLETKCKKGKMETIRVKLGYTGLFVVNLVGLSGGLALLWEEQEVEIQNFTFAI